MLTTDQARGVIELLGESCIQAMQVAAVVSKQHGKNIDKEYEEAKKQMEIVIHNALHVNSIQPDPKDALPPEDDGDVIAANDPTPKVPA